MVKTKLADKPIGVVGFSFILILKACLKMKGKSTSNKRKLFFKLRSISVMRNRDAF